MGMNREIAFINFMWKLMEQVGAQIISFIVSIILARILIPEDYSAVSIILILSSFCKIFIDGGLSNALIQKKNPDTLDYSTVLLFSLSLSVVLYVILFILSPIIAEIYNLPILVNIIRIYSLSLIVGAFSTVQSAYIAKNLLFKKYFFSTIGGTIVSGLIGISMAFAGFGAWSLVAQHMINLLVGTIILFFTTNFRPKFKFSLIRFKEMFKYGIRILGTSLLDMLYDKIRPLIVGLKFSSIDLAFYEKGSSYPGLINGTLSSTLGSVLFPVISNVQDDLGKVKNITRKFMEISSFFIYPALLGLAAISDNLIPLMLTEKWNGSIVYVKVFCIYYMFSLLQTGNLQAIKAIGRSDIVFKLATIKKSINFLLLVFVVFFSDSPVYLAALGILTSLIAFVINSFTNKKMLEYGFLEQIKDIFLNLFSATLMAILVSILGRIKMNLILLIIFQILAGIIIYIIFAICFKNSSFKYCIETLIISRKKKHKS